MISTNSAFDFVPSPEHSSTSCSAPIDSESTDCKVNSTNLTQENQSETVEETGQNLNLAVSQTSGFKRWQRSLHLVDGDSQTQSSPTAEISESNADDVSRYLRETLETLAY